MIPVHRHRSFLEKEKKKSRLSLRFPGRIGAPRVSEDSVKKRTNSDAPACTLSMKKKRTAQSAFFTPRAVLALVVCSAAACSLVSGALLAFFGADAPSNRPERILTFAERVAYQRAIEEVYWPHRIWPRGRGERPDPKPSLDAVMPQAQLEKKVADYLRKS